MLTSASSRQSSPSLDDASVSNGNGGQPKLPAVEFDEPRICPGPARLPASGHQMKIGARLNHARHFDHVRDRDLKGGRGGRGCASVMKQSVRDMRIATQVLPFHQHVGAVARLQRGRVTPAPAWKKPSTFRSWSASLALPTLWPIMPSADFCIVVRASCRSLGVSPTAFIAHPSVHVWNLRETRRSHYR